MPSSCTASPPCSHPFLRSLHRCSSAVQCGNCSQAVRPGRTLGNAVRGATCFSVCFHPEQQILNMVKLFGKPLRVNKAAADRNTQVRCRGCCHCRPVCDH